MSRFDDNGLTPMEGGLKVKKETISIEPEENVVLGKDDIHGRSLEAYIKYSNVKTLAKDMHKYKMDLEKQNKAIEKANHDIKQLSDSVEHKRKAVLKQLKKKLDSLNNIWLDSKADINICKSSGAPDIVQKTLEDTLHRYKTLTAELSNGLETLIDLDSHVEGLHNTRGNHH